MLRSFADSLRIHCEPRVGEVRALERVGLYSKDTAAGYGTVRYDTLGQDRFGSVTATKTNPRTLR